MTETLAPSSLSPVSQERRIVTAIPGPKSVALHERRLAAVPLRVSSALTVDVDGNQFIDLGAGIGVTTIGHTDEAVVAAAASQLKNVIHTLFTITPYES